MKATETQLKELVRLASKLCPDGMEIILDEVADLVDVENEMVAAGRPIMPAGWYESQPVEMQLSGD